MRLAALAVLLLAGCGGASGGTDSPVEGNWVVTIGQCAEGLTFTGDNYARLVLCPDATSAALDLSEETGTFRIQNNLIVYTAEQTTCPATVTKVYNTPFSVSGSSLTLTYSDGVTIFARNLASGGSAVATFGCFSAGMFTPGPLVAL